MCALPTPLSVTFADMLLPCPVPSPISWVMSPEQQRGHRLTGVRAGRAVSSNRSHNSQPLFFFFKAGEICSDETAQSIMSIEDKRRAILLKRELKGPDSCLLGPLPPP